MTPAKTTRPDRKNDRRRGGGRQREPSEFAEATLSVDRVTRVVKGGRRMRFRAIVVVGNRKGKVGLGTGKATEVQAAVRKAVSSAKRQMIRIPILNGTIPHDVELKFKAARVRLLPALPGTGIIAGGALRVILDHAGVKNVLSKRYGTRNKLVNAQAAMLALQKLRPIPAHLQEKIDLAEAKAVADKAAPEVKLMSKEEVEKQKDIHRQGKIE
jgi:small subunit ribosomal protein S5